MCLGCFLLLDAKAERGSANRAPVLDHFRLTPFYSNRRGIFGTSLIIASVPLLLSLRFRLSEPGVKKDMGSSLVRI